MNESQEGTVQPARLVRVRFTTTTEADVFLPEGAAEVPELVFVEGRDTAYLQWEGPSLPLPTTLISRNERAEIVAEAPTPEQSAAA